MSDDLKRKIQVLRDNFEIYAEKNLKIKTKDGSLEKFVLNDPQKYIHSQLEKQLAETGKIRAIILKGRQQGASTYTEGRFYWRTSLNVGKNTFVLTQEQSASDNLFNMAKRFHDCSHPALKPEVGASNVKELYFSKLDSGYKVGTSGSKSVGRSATIQYFHGSELAFWPNAQEHFAGILQCIPEAPGTEVILESTANGLNFFHTLWMQAIQGIGSYIPVFIPWYWSKEYRKDAAGFKPSEEELSQQKIYGLDLEQLAWRRSKITEMGKLLCEQEYPMDWMQAFITSGRGVFDKELTAAALKECWSPKKKMVLENDKWVERVDGELSVWSMPKQGYRYVISADVAEGRSGGDFSCADVREVVTGNQVAQWHGHIAPDLFANVLCSLGRWYGGSSPALLGIENNNHGLTVNIACRDKNYPNIFVQTSIDDRGGNSNETRRLGFLTTSKSKPYIIDLLSAALREGTHGIACRETVQEMMTYIVEENGSYNAVSSAFDDRVMSYAISEFLIQQVPAYKRNNR